MLKGQRIALYARYSTDKQNPRSIEDQLRVCRDYVERNGGSLDDALVFTDAALSGAGDSMLRPGWQALHEAVRSERVTAVVVEDLSRIARDVESSARTLRQFKSWGARLLAINDHIDTAQGGAKMSAFFKSIMADHYVEELRERTRRGMHGLHLAGAHTGGRVFGYHTVPWGDGSSRKRLQPDPAEAEIVRRIFEQQIIGVPLRVIAQRLNSEGIPSPRGGKWQHVTVRAILQNEIYDGRLYFNRRRWERDYETGKRRYKEQPRSEWRTADRPDLRIVDAATWAAAQSRIRKIERDYKAMARPKRAYPLSGLLVCGECGEPMILSGGKGLYYQCGGQRKGFGCDNRKALREPAIRQWVLDRICDTLGKGDLIEEMRVSWASSVGDHDREMKAELRQRRDAASRADGQVKRLYSMVADGDDTPQLRELIAEKLDHAELQRAAIARIEGELGRVPTIPSATQIRAFLGRLGTLAMSSPYEAKTLLARLIAGPVRCTPQGEDYAVRFQVAPEALLNATSAAPAGTTLVSGSCGGAILPLTSDRIVSGMVPRLYGRKNGK